MQHECIPQAILGMDVLCQAKSGMGKTAVFVLSVLQQIEPATPPEVAAIVLCHTRELAYQVPFCPKLRCIDARRAESSPGAACKGVGQVAAPATIVRQESAFSCANMQRCVEAAKHKCSPVQRCRLRRRRAFSLLNFRTVSVRRSATSLSGSRST